ncbi:hypothetical protein CR513_16410, partial [Mucuna pruriens]
MQDQARNSSILVEEMEGDVWALKIALGFSMEGKEIKTAQVALEPSSVQSHFCLESQGPLYAYYNVLQ